MCILSLARTHMDHNSIDALNYWIRYIFRLTSFDYMCCEVRKKMDSLSLGNRAFAVIVKHPRLWKIWLNFSHRWWKFSRKNVSTKRFWQQTVAHDEFYFEWTCVFFSSISQQKCQSFASFISPFSICLLLFFLVWLATVSFYICFIKMGKRAWKELCRSVIILLSRHLFCFLILWCK